MNDNQTVKMTKKRVNEGNNHSSLAGGIQTSGEQKR